MILFCPVKSSKCLSPPPLHKSKVPYLELRLIIRQQWHDPKSQKKYLQGRDFPIKMVVMLIKMSKTQKIEDNYAKTSSN